MPDLNYFQVLLFVYYCTKSKSENYPAGHEQKASAIVAFSLCRITQELYGGADTAVSRTTFIAVTFQAINSRLKHACINFTLSGNFIKVLKEWKNFSRNTNNIHLFTDEH